MSSYKYDVPDLETNLLVTEDSSKKLQIHGATLLKIVQKLTSIDCLRIDAAFQDTVFVTMTTFASPTYFLDSLAARYAVPSELEVGADVHRETYVPIQLRVIKLIKFWIEHYFWEYFAHDPKLLAALRQWLQERCTQEYVKPHVEALLRNIAEVAAATPYREPAQTLPFASAKAALRSNEADPHVVSLAEFSAVDVARQVAQRLHLLARVVEWHALNKHALESVARQFGASEADPLCVVGSPPTSAPQSLPPSVIAYANAYWDLRQYVEDEVLVCVHAAAEGVTKSDAVLARQQALVQLFCDVALELFALRCYTGAFAFVAVLHGKLGKKQLKPAWKNVSKKKEARLAELLALASPKKRFKELRAHTAADDGHAHTPWPPAAADVLLETLASAPDFLPSGLGDLIDMDKRARLAAQLRRLRASQVTPYPFLSSPFLDYYLALTPTARRHLDADPATAGGAAPGLLASTSTASLRRGASSVSSHDDGEDTLDDDEPTETTETNDSDDEGAQRGTARNRALSEAVSPGGGKSRSGSISAMSTPSKRQGGLTAMVRNLTRSQRSKRDDAVSPPVPAAVETLSTRNRSSSVGKATRKVAHPAGLVSTLRSNSRQDDERSGDDEAGSDSDSGGGGGGGGAGGSGGGGAGGGESEADALSSPRLRAVRALRRARATSDAAASESEQLSFVNLLDKSGSGGDAATLRSVLLQALKSSVAARHLLLQRLDVASGGQLSAPVRQFDDDEEERMRASNRVREALDLASAQTAHLNSYIVTSRAHRTDTASSSPTASPRDSSSPRAASPSTATMFTFPTEATVREKRARSGSSLRSSSVESHSPPNGSPRMRDSVAKAMALGPTFSLMSHSSTSAGSGGSALSRRTSLMPVDVDVPELDAALASALAHLYPGRQVRPLVLDDKAGRIYGWPASVPLCVLSDDADDSAPPATPPAAPPAASKSGSVALMVNAFRAIADGVAADDAEPGRAIPLSVTTAVDAAQLAAFVRTCQAFAQSKGGSGIGIGGGGKVQGVLALRLIDDALAQHASNSGVRVVVF